MNDERPPLERAIERGQALIVLGADKGEPEDTQLSDVLADLMHWANHNHVDFDEAVASAQHARQQEIEEWDCVLVSITNTYEDGHESEYEVWVPAPADWGVPNEDWWEDVVFPHTGDGTGENLSAVYEATIIELSGRNSNDTTLCGVTHEWQG